MNYVVGLLNIDSKADGHWRKNYHAKSRHFLVRPDPLLTALSVAGRRVCVSVDDVWTDSELNVDVVLQEALNFAELLVGESIILPSIVQIDPCEDAPSSNDIPYWQLWKQQWKEMNFSAIKSEWYK